MRAVSDHELSRHRSLNALLDVVEAYLSVNLEEGLRLRQLAYGF